MFVMPSASPRSIATLAVCAGPWLAFAGIPAHANSQASALVIQTTEDVKLCSAPADLNLGQTEADAICLFEERTNVQLAETLPVNAAQMGTFQGNGDPTVATLMAGEVLDSFLLHFDRNGAPQEALIRQGAVRFVQPLVGLIFEGKNLLETHGIFGRQQDITYATSEDNGFDAPLDQLKWEGSQELEIKLSSDIGLDQIRILVRSSAMDANGTNPSDGGSAPSSPSGNGPLFTTFQGGGGCSVDNLNKPFSPNLWWGLAVSWLALLLLVERGRLRRRFVSLVCKMYARTLQLLRDVYDSCLKRCYAVAKHRRIVCSKRI